MNVTIIDKHAFVTLSRRNLEHLNKMLEHGVGGALERQDGEFGVSISVEENDVHYKDREAGPGYPLAK